MDQAVAKALRILEILAVEGTPIRISRLSEQADLSKSTAHRILQSLIELSFVDQEAETGRYGASLKLWELGSAVVVAHPVRRAVGGFLQTLRQETGETVSLLVPSGDDVVYLEKLVSPRAVRFSARAGSRVPAPLTAGGRAMLAYDPNAREIVERVAARLEGAPRTIDVPVFMADLAGTRQRGYSISRDNPDVVSLGCALLARDGRAAAALSVSAPLERAGPEGEARLANALLETRARLMETVGFL